MEKIKILFYALRFSVFPILFFILIDNEVALTQDTIGGVVWSPAVKISPGNFPAGDQKMAIQGDTIHLVYDYYAPFVRLPYHCSTNNGETFSSLRDLITDTVRFPFTNIYRLSLLVNATRLFIFFIGGDDAFGETKLHMMYSEDRGDTWSDVRDITDSIFTPWAPATIRNDTIALMGQYGRTRTRTLISTNNGAEWRVNPDRLIAYDYDITLSTGRLHYFDTFNTPVPEVFGFQSTDVGFSWSSSEMFSSDDGYGSGDPFVCSKKDSLYLTWRDSKYGCIGIGCTIFLRRSFSNGSDWQPEQHLTAQPWGVTQNMYVKYPLAIAGWSIDSGPITHFEVTYSLDGGDSWSSPFRLDTPMEFTAHPVPLITKDNTIVMVYGKANPGNDDIKVWYRRGVFIPSAVQERLPSVPLSAILHSAFPNPFNSSTEIRYNLPFETYVSLKIYDVYGKTVEILTQKFEGLGEHTVMWNADAHASGLYFYRIETCEHSTGGKIVLVK